MNITEVRIKLMDEQGERLKAFCSITFDDCFVIRDLKIIDGATGPFVAMPSRKLTCHCFKCGAKNHLRANFCNQCGGRLQESRIIKDADGRAKLYADIAHPINSACREMIQEFVVNEYYHELERAKQPGYVSRYDEFDAGDYDEVHETRRIDRPHERATTGEPHRGPSGQGASRPIGGPHTRPDRAGADSHHAAVEKDFGAGIFDA